MQRRSLTGALALAPIACLVGSPSHAQPAPKSSSPEGVRPFRAVKVPEDGRRVLFFFDFACPFCAAYHDPLLNFSQTVPSRVQTLFVPVVNMADPIRSREQMIAAKCFYAAFEVATRAQVAQFANAVYAAYPDSRSLDDMAIWTKAIAASGINRKAYAAALRSPANDTQVKFAGFKTAQYGLQATPSVAVGGKYVITPDDVAGDQQMFFNIVNGLTSEIL